MNCKGQKNISPRAKNLTEQKKHASVQLAAVYQCIKQPLTL